MSNIALVVVDAHKLEYTRYLNRIWDVRVRSKVPLSTVEVEEFRANPGACVEGLLPSEPVRRA